MRILGGSLPCGVCGEKMPLTFREFVDAKENPQYKKMILDGSFFNVVCPKCGTAALVEYPVMYMDPDKKLNIYMVPRHDRNLIANLNSLKLPEDKVDGDEIKRVTSSSEDLVEKILIYDRGRDDRIIELYKLLISERMRVQWPEMYRTKMLFLPDERGDMFVVRDFNREPGGEKLTVVLNEEDYDSMEKDFGKYLKTQPGEFVEVNRKWIEGRIDRGN